MTKSGNKINQLLKEQGLDWHDYGRCSLWSGKNHLATLLNGYCKNATSMHIHSLEDGSYMIDNGVLNKKHHTYKMYADNVKEENLLKVFQQIIQKEVDLSNLLN